MSAHLIQEQRAAHRSSVNVLHTQTNTTSFGEIHKVSIQSLALCCSPCPPFGIEGMRIGEYFRVHEHKVVCFANKALISRLVSIFSCLRISPKWITYTGWNCMILVYQRLCGRPAWRSTRDSRRQAQSLKNNSGLIPTIRDSATA